MPERRTISRNISTNYRIAELPDSAQKLFTWMILWADVEGRLPGEPKLLKKIVSPLSDYADEDVDKWLDMMQDQKDDETNLGLVERYELNGHKYIWMPGFEKHQAGRMRNKDGSIREAPSHIPPPPKEIMDRAKEKIIETIARGKEQSVGKTETDDIKVAYMIKLYEDQVGIMLTPNQLQTIVEFADTYPDGWFEKALEEAVNNKAQSPVRYIEKIMENWRVEGGNPLDGRKRKGSSINKGNPRKVRTPESYTDPTSL